MIQTIEIPREDWPTFLHLFNRMTRDRPIRVELESEDLGVQPLGGVLTFGELSYEPGGSEAGSLMLIATSDSGDFTHPIEKPGKLQTGHNELGLLEWLSIESANGRLLIHFEDQPELPDVLSTPHAQA